MLMWEKEIEKFRSAKAKYIKAHGSAKRQLETEIISLKEGITSWTRKGEAVQGFDWAVEFAEVFEDGGFDIIVANPPYVRMELFKDLKPVLRTNFSAIHADRSDLYCYFYARAAELLSDKGMLCFISSNKWFRAKYGAPLRKFMAQEFAIHSITDFGELPVFKAATFPMIFIGQKHCPNGVTVFTQVKSLEPPYPDVLAIVRGQGEVLPHGSIAGSEWRFAGSDSAAIFSKMEAAGQPLAEYVPGQIFYGVKSGFNDAFFINAMQRKAIIQQKPKCASVIKPLVVGDSVRKWRIDRDDVFLIYMNHGIDVSELSPILGHMKPFKLQLEQRATNQAWYELQQPQARYAKQFPKPKILYPIIAKEPRFTMDRSGSWINDKVFAIPVEDYYLLGVLNSWLVWEYLKSICSSLGDPQKGGRLELRAVYLSKVPIPKAASRDRDRIGSLAMKCIEREGQSCEELESEIDDLVCRLYGVSRSDAMQAFGTPEQHKRARARRTVAGRD